VTYLLTVRPPHLPRELLSHEHNNNLLKLLIATDVSCDSDYCENRVILSYSKIQKPPEKVVVSAALSLQVTRQLFLSFAKGCIRPEVDIVYSSEFRDPCCISTPNVNKIEQYAAKLLRERENFIRHNMNSNIMQ